MIHRKNRTKLKTLAKELADRICRELRRRGTSFILEPFLIYLRTIKNESFETVFADPRKGYQLVLDYFRGDREAAYFFLDYLLALAIPGDYEIRNRLINAMIEGDSVTLQRILIDIIESD